MTPGRLLVGGFLLVLASSVFNHLWESGGATVGARLKGAMRECASAGFAFVMIWMIAGALVTPAVGFVAELFGCERGYELDARQHRALERVVELDLAIAAPAIQGDPRLRRQQAERKSDAEKERAKVWKRFVKANRVRALPRWITQGEQYVLALAPLLIMASVSARRLEPRGSTRRPGAQPAKQ